MPDFKRASRVAALLRQEISRIISLELKDPRVQMVTITRIKLTDDLSYARVFTSILGDDAAQQSALTGLTHAANYIRTTLRKLTDLRIVPHLEFILDDSAEYAQNIQVIIDQLHEEQGPEPDDT